MTVPLPPSEVARLLDLAHYQGEASGPMPELDRLCRLTARLLQVPFAVVNFVDALTTAPRGQSWSGPGGAPRPREETPCGLTVLQDVPLQIEDLQEDARFADQPYVAVDGLRMYAGAPLLSPAGERIGTLCVFDRAVRHLGPEDLTALEDLAVVVMNVLRLQAQTRLLEGHLGQALAGGHDLARRLEHAHALERISALGELPVSPEEVAWLAAQDIGRTIQVQWSGLLVFQGETVRTRVAYQVPDLHPVLLSRTERPEQLTSGLTGQMKGLQVPRYVSDYPSEPAALPDVVAAGMQAAAYVPLGSWEDTTFLLLVFRSGDTVPVPWSEEHRALLESAARSVRVALSRRWLVVSAQASARTDALTGAFNRRALEEDLPTLLASGTPFSVVLTDLDGFKRLNDMEGHAAGDRVLQAFASGLREPGPVGVAGGPSAALGRVYRLGGDEFVWLSASAPDAPEIQAGIDRALLACRHVSLTQIGASYGVAAHTEGAGLLALADQRMYRTKSQLRRGAAS